jgi:phenylacetate-CoA ligase
MDDALTEEQRFPLLTAAGRRMLRWLQEHPHAPRYNFPCGDRLTAGGLLRVRAFAAALDTAPRGWRWGELPPWLKPFAAFCLAEVPFYRRAGGSADDFFALPTASHEDLRRQPWAFVPDSQPLDDLLVYTTSGTTGSRLTVLSDPETPAKYLPLLQAALATRGILLEGGSDRVALVQICAQKQTYTMATVCAYLGEAGYAKINLNPAEWRDPDDRAPFLESCQPEVYTGDPVAFLELMKLPLRARPKALISSAMALVPAFQERLEAHFGCPVIDLYGTTESGPVAAAGRGGFDILPHDLYVEALRPDGTACRPGERGEITLTGGRNPFLPLLRYRTGDWASLEFHQEMPVLAGLEGRPPVVFKTAAGQWLNSIDVTTVLHEFPLSQFSLNQARDGALDLTVRGHDVPLPAIREALLGLFGPDQRLAIQELSDPESWSGKVIQYSSALSPFEHP